MAIAHIAIFEAVNAIDGRYESYVQLRREQIGTSVNAAVAQAAHDTLASLYASQRATFGARLAGGLGAICDREARARGVDLGRQAAAAILALRANDGSDHAEALYGVDWIPSDTPGAWHKDPISQSKLALGAKWGVVRPFVLRAATAFRVPPPPPLDSEECAAAFDEVKALGGDGITTATIRTPVQAETGIYWAYDGTPSLCAPPRLYNQIAVQIADQMGTGSVALARLLALVNVAMADAGIAATRTSRRSAHRRAISSR
jgi:hypothetical protein